MAGFEYQALDATGRTVKGVIEGDAERHVRAALRDKGLTPLRVDAIQTRATANDEQRGPTLRRGLSSGDLALLTRQFATLVGAGLTIEECLNVIIEQTESARTCAPSSPGCAAACSKVSHCTAACRASPRPFPEIYRAMVDAGEQSGKLAEVLDRLADFTENREGLRQRVQLAFIYPALVTIVAVGVISLLLIYVVPRSRACSPTPVRPCRGRPRR